MDATPQKDKIKSEIQSYEDKMACLRYMLMNLDMTADPEEKGNIRKLINEFTTLQEKFYKLKAEPSKDGLNTFKALFDNLKSKIRTKC